jgi:predicted O-methyltransferase YrrM
MEIKHPLIDNKLEKLFEVNGISKQIQDSQYEVLEDLVRLATHPNMSVVEIGSWSGSSAVIIGSVVQRVFGKLYCIDWYKGDESNDGYLKATAEKFDIPAIFKRNIEYFKLTNTVELKIMSSEEASLLFEDNTLHLVFIDGSHNYTSVLNDINLWYPKLITNYIICGHDYNMDGVKKAVNEKFKQVNIKEDIWWTKKV